MKTFIKLLINNIHLYMICCVQQEYMLGINYSSNDITQVSNCFTFFCLKMCTYTVQV